MKYLSTIVAFFVLLNFCSAQISTNIPAQSIQNETLWESIGDLPMQNLPTFEREKILKEDENTVNSNRFAAPLLVNFDLNNSGKWLNLANGDRVWILKVRAKDALSLHILYDNFKLPKGATLHVYNESKTTVLGAFTSINNKKDGKFTTGIIQDDNLILEYYEPIDKKGEGIISINRIDYGYRSTLEKKSTNKKTNDFGDSDACNVNINCATGNDWQDEKKGVVRILVVMSNGSGWCTGSLINNTNNNGTPYVLSAFHCQDGGTPLYSQWTFYFNYEAAGCSNPSSQPTLQSVVGATEKSKYNPSDFLLLELSNSVPSAYNPYYNGWDKSSTIPSNSTSIHHPAGDIKKISVDNQSPAISAYSGGTGTSHWEVIWNTGTTEGGSSGSPLFNASGQIIGQLHGGGASCASLLSPDYYGRFSQSWTGGGTNSTRLSNWLDPTSSGVASINGYSGGGGGGGGTGLVNGCAGSSQYPSGTLTPTTSWQTAASNIYAGEYSVYNVTAGEIYEWSICSADGGNATYNTELTLTDASNNELAYNDDFCSTQSKITWTATITGTVRVHVTQYHCLTNSSNTTLVYKKQNSGTPNLDKVTDNLTVSGSSVTISATIENNGTAAAAAFSVRFYASTNTSISTTDTEIYTATATNGLAAGASAIASSTVDLCTITGLTSGTTYYIGYLIDYANTVAESDETDNNWAWTNNPIALACQTGCVGTSQYPTATFTPTASWQTASTQIYAGEYSVYNVVAGTTYEWSLCTADGGNASYDSELTLTTSSNGFLAYEDDICGDDAKITWIATITGTVRVHVHEYQCQTNSTNTTLVYRSVGSSGSPNLLSAGGGTLNMTGTTANITVNIQNNGTAAAGAFVVRFYASTNTTISNTDQEIAVENITSLATNTTTSKSVTVDLCNIAGFSPSGSYYIGFLIDEPNQVTESNETDNSSYFSNAVAINCVTTSTITVSANPTAGGSATGGGTFNNGQSATVTATTNTGWIFDGWKENGTLVSSNVSYTFTVTANRTLTAEFSQQQFTVSASANPIAGGSTTGNGIFAYGQSATVTATTNTGWIFDGWKENGTLVSSNVSYTFNVTANRTLTAEFSQQQFTVNLTADSLQGGTVAGGGTYNYGQQITVIATPTTNSPWIFEGWYEGGVFVSNAASYTFTVVGNRNLMANFDFDVNTNSFQKENIEWTISPNPSSGFVRIDIQHDVLNFDIIHIYNIMGQLVKTTNMNNQKSQLLDLSELSEGTYLIQIFTKELNQFITSKVVIIK